MSGIIQKAPTAAQTLASGTEGVFAVGYGYYPGEGSRCVTVIYDWTVLSGYAEDASQLVSKGLESTVQSVYIDNSGNTQSVTMTVQGTGQVIVCPASSQGIFPLFFTGVPSFNIITTAAGVPTPIAASTRCYFLNFPISPAVWHV